MSLALVYSRAQVGIDAPLVSVEVHLSNGLPGLSIVGLPETEVKESKDRVRSALLNSRFDYPARRITVNLAPADLPKEGGRFDLAIALGILAASGQIPLDALAQYEVCRAALADAYRRAGRTRWRNTSVSVNWPWAASCVRCAGSCPPPSRAAGPNAP